MKGGGQLCTTVLGISADTIAKRDVIDSLEQCCLLLDGIPETIITVMRQLHSKEIALEHFFLKLHTHTAGVDLKADGSLASSSSILTDLFWCNMSENPIVTPELTYLNKCFGFYWLKGPNVINTCKSIGLDVKILDMVHFHLLRPRVFGAG